MPTKTAEQRERAEAKFERLQKVAEEGRVAMAEYKAAATAARQKTEKLRALRLALEAEAESASKIAPKRARQSRKAS